MRFNFLHIPAATIRAIGAFVRNGAGAARAVILTAAVISALLLCLPSPGRTETEQAGEYQVKSAYLYNFAKYIDWPAEGSVNSGTFTICILGKSPFGNALGAIAGKSVRGKHVAVTYINRIEDLKECQILYIAASEKGNLSQILATVASRPILTVSDTRRFATSGGAIGFVIVNDKIRFEINQRIAHRAGLRISAQLLKLATTVTD